MQKQAPANHQDFTQGALLQQNKQWLMQEHALHAN